MSGYLSNLLTNTTSRYNSLRRNLLSDEADGDTEDDSHVSRVLRAYYTEKGRSLPQWLPPDSRKAQQAIPAQSSYQSIWQSSTAPTQPSPNMNSGNRGSGGLSDLWDNAPRNTSPQPTSLRRQPGQRPPGGHQQPQQSYEPVQARPLPSQRAGSYQTQRQQYADPSPPPSSGSTTSGGGTAQERLKARLYGSARAGSPSFNSSSGGGGGGGRFG